MNYILVSPAGRDFMKNYERWLKNVENHVGLSSQEIKDKSPEKIKEHLIKKTGKNISYESAFPVIGRGNVLRDSIVTSKEINKEIDKILA